MNDRWTNNYVDLDSGQNDRINDTIKWNRLIYIPIAKYHSPIVLSKSQEWRSLEIRKKNKTTQDKQYIIGLKYMD